MIISAVMQGLLYGILGLGIYLTFRILNFPDMTTEGSYPLGAAVAVILINMQVNPILATIAGALSGCLAGLVTGLLYTKGKIPILLSGILVMSSINSVILFIMGRSNLGLLGSQTVIHYLPFSKDVNWLLVGFFLVTLVIAGIIFFLYTRLGQAYIATGDNPDMAKSFGINTDRTQVMGLIISNGIIAFSGALIAQQDGYADVSKGIGIIVVGLASIIIGEVLYTNLTLLERLVAIVVGAILYWALMTAIIRLGFSAHYLKICSATLLALCLIFPVLKEKFFKETRFNG